MKERYNKNIMIALHEVLEIDTNETINDIRKIYSTTEILNAVLTYEGICGYAETVIGWIKDIYGIDLNEVEDSALDALSSEARTQQNVSLLKESLIKHIGEFEVPSELVIDFGPKAYNRP